MVRTRFEEVVVRTWVGGRQFLEAAGPSFSVLSEETWVMRRRSTGLALRSIGLSSY